MATQAIDPPYVSDIDPFSHEAILDAIHHDSLLREVGPVVYLPQYDIWVVARHAEVQEVLKDWETYSSEGRPFYDPTSIRPEVLLTSDPPVHTRVRGLDPAGALGPGDAQDGRGLPRRGGRAGRGAARGRPGRARRLQGPLGAVRAAGVPGHDRDAAGGPPLPHGVRRRGLPGLRAAQRAVGEGRARGRRGDRLRRALLPARRAGAGRHRSRDLRVGRRRARSPSSRPSCWSRPCTRRARTRRSSRSRAC